MALLSGLSDWLLATVGFGGNLVESVVVGVLGVVEAATEKLRLVANQQGLVGWWLADDLATRLGLPIRLENGTGEGAVLMGALAYGLRSSLDSVFANDARSALARLSPAQLGRRLTLSCGGGASPPGRRGVNS